MSSDNSNSMNRDNPLASSASASSSSLSYRKSSQKVRNPYAKSSSIGVTSHSSALSQKSKQERSSGTTQLGVGISQKSASGGTNTSTNTTNTTPCREFNNALREYLDSSGSNDHDVNTSFSVASFAMRQRKLLRKISFELEQMASRLRDDDDSNINGENNNKTHRQRSDDKSDSIHCQLMLLKGVGCHAEVSLPRQTAEYAVKVMNSVSTLLLEEYIQRRDDNASVGQHEDHDHGGAKINPNTSYWNNNNNINIASETDNVDDSICATLEFLNVAYTYLESNLIYASLQTSIDCEGFRCIDVTKDDSVERISRSGCTYFLRSQQW